MVSLRVGATHGQTVPRIRIPPSPLIPPSGEVPVQRLLVYGGYLYNEKNSRVYALTLNPTPPVDRQNLGKAYVEMGNAYPDMLMSTVNFAYDNAIAGFYASLDDGGAVEWSSRNRALHAEIDAKLPNYSYFIAPGSDHCTILYPSFYSLEVKGVRLLDWVKNAVNDVKVETVDCDPDCGTP